MKIEVSKIQCLKGWKIYSKGKRNLHVVSETGRVRFRRAQIQKHRTLKKAPDTFNFFETRYESNFVCPTKVLS